MWVYHFSNVLVRTSIREPTTCRNETNCKMSIKLVATVAKLSISGCGMVEGEAELTLDDLLKRPVRRPLPRTSRPSSLLLACRGRRMNTTKIKLVLVVIPTAVGALVAT